MLDDAFTHLKREIETGKIEIALLEMLDDSQSVEIVIERATVGTHQFVQLALPGMPKRRMADVMDEGESFREIGVESKRGGHGARDLPDLESVRQAIAKMVGEASGEDLGLRFQAAESARMDNAVAVSRVFIAVRMRRFRVAAPAGFFRGHRPGGAQRRMCGC